MTHEHDPSFWQFHLENAKTVGDRELEAVALTSLGASYAAMAQYHRAIEKYQQAIHIFQELGDLNREIWALNNLGTSYSSLRLHNRAIEAYLQAIAVARVAGELVREGWVLRNLGHTYRSMARYEEAITAVEAAIAVFQERGTTEELAGATQLLREICQEHHHLKQQLSSSQPDR